MPKRTLPVECRAGRGRFHGTSGYPYSKLFFKKNPWKKAKKYMKFLNKM
jgi:hypothetical protein